MITIVLFLNSWMMIIKLRGYQEQIKCIKFHEKVVGILTHLMHLFNNETSIRVNFVSAFYCKKTIKQFIQHIYFQVQQFLFFVIWLFIQVLIYFLTLDVICWILIVSNRVNNFNCCVRYFFLNERRKRYLDLEEK